MDQVTLVAPSQLLPPLHLLLEKMCNENGKGNSLNMFLELPEAWTPLCRFLSCSILLRLMLGSWSRVLG